MWVRVVPCACCILARYPSVTSQTMTRVPDTLLSVLRMVEISVKSGIQMCGVGIGTTGNIFRVKIQKPNKRGRMDKFQIAKAYLTEALATGVDPETAIEKAVQIRLSGLEFSSDMIQSVVNGLWSLAKELSPGQHLSVEMNDRILSKFVSSADFAGLIADELRDAPDMKDAGVTSEDYAQTLSDANDLLIDSM